MRKATGWILLLGAGVCVAREPFPVEEEPVAKAITQLRKDIERDTEALNALRAQIDAERTPLAEKMEKLRNTVSERRQEIDRIRQARTQGQREQTALRTRTAALQEEATYLRSLFSEYARSLDTRLNVARPASLITSLRELQVQIDQEQDLPTTVEALLSLSQGWSIQQLGGTRFEGVALDAEGIEHSGSFALRGPAAYFAATETTGPVGIAMLQLGSDNPALFQSFETETLAQLRKLTAGEAAAIPLDVSNGDAIRVADAKPTLVEQLQKGGYTMIPLGLVAVVCVGVALIKTAELARMKTSDDKRIGAVLEALRDGDPEKARSIAETVPFPCRRLVEDLIEHRDAPREHLEEIMHEHVLASLPAIERNLGALAVLGGVATLLGLLGTVTGMINTFRLVTLFGSGDTGLLSGGISEALVTTATGLVIAIPTLLIHAFLSRWARGLIGKLEMQSTTLVNDWKLRGQTT